MDFSKHINYIVIKDNGKVTGITIKNIDLSLIVEELYPLVDPKNNLCDPMIHQHFKMLSQEQKLLLASQMLITRYCLHRILIHLKVYLSNSWTYKIGADYYGEEVQMISLNPNIARQVDILIESLRLKNITEKLEKILTLEYGHLIPSVRKKKWYVKQVNFDELYFSNEEHLEECKLDLEKQPDYKKSLETYPYPRAITILNQDGKYKVIDGYHRLMGCQEYENPIIIYCLRDEE